MAMLDRRWLPAALLGGAGVIGWLSAMGANAGLASWLALPEDAELTDLSGASAPATPSDGPSDGGDVASFDGGDGGDGGDNGDNFEPRSGELRREEWVDPIVRRNIFDSSKVGKPSEEGPISGEGRRTDLKVVLLATVVATPEIYSSALIAPDDRAARGTGYGVGDDLMGEATIVKIEQKRVFIRRSDGAVEYLDMENKGGEEAPRKGGDDTEGGSVSKDGDNKFTVDRSLLESAMANPESLAGQVRVVPHKGADGEIDGYRLSGIRKGSVFEQLGIKNGDIVHTVNGKALTSTANAMDAYSSLQNERSFSFEITRRSKRQTMEYEVR